MKKYPVALPYIKEEEIRAVTKVLRGGHLSLGPQLLAFEQAFAKRIGTKYACACSSGTAGLHMAMIAAGIGPGDEVITTPFSFIASSNCVLYVGAKPIFIDIDPRTYNMDPKLIEKKITKRTKAILVVHIFGQAAEMGPIMKLAKKYKLKIIEDACESICATRDGKAVGTFGESAVFAFYPNKQMTTGEGGMLVTDDKRIFTLAKSLCNQGRADNMQWLDHERLGYNYRLDEMSAALGVEQLKRIGFLVRERQKICHWYDQALAPYAKLVQTPYVDPKNEHTYFVYVVKLLGKRVKRDTVIEDLKRRGISSKPYLPSIHLFDFYRKKFGFKPGDFPIAEDVSARSLALPLYVGLTKADVGAISSELNRVLQKYAD